jgi:hypothetical protein
LQILLRLELFHSAVTKLTTRPNSEVLFEVLAAMSVCVISHIDVSPGSQMRLLHINRNYLCGIVELLDLTLGSVFQGRNYQSQMMQLDLLQSNVFVNSAFSDWAFVFRRLSALAAGMERSNDIVRINEDRIEREGRWDRLTDRRNYLPTSFK